jgi:hypothetical protein
LTAFPTRRALGPAFFDACAVRFVAVAVVPRVRRAGLLRRGVAVFAIPLSSGQHAADLLCFLPHRVDLSSEPAELPAGFPDLLTDPSEIDFAGERDTQDLAVAPHRGATEQYAAGDADARAQN